MAREPVATLVVAGLPQEIVAALRARLDGCTVLEAATDDELRERVREAPEVLALAGWSLGDDPAATLRAWRRAGTLSATKVVCCLATPADPSLPSQLVDELSVSRLLFLPLDVEETLRHLGELAGVPVLPATPVSRESRVGAGIAAVWARFREPTLARIDVIDSAAMALLDGALTNEQRLDAQREAHKLAGAAGSFGFPRSTQIARQIEEQLSLAGLAPADAVPMAEQLLMLRADLEGTPRLAESEPAGEQRREEVTLLLVGADGALNERMVSEGAARAVRVVIAPDPGSARSLAEREVPTVVAVCIATMDQAAPSLDLVEALANAERSAAGLVLAPRDADAVRVEAARRGARRFVELSSSPSTIVTHVLELAGHASAAPRRVLAVDDDPRILELLRTVLGWSGREVHTISDPLRFWSVLDQVRPDLLVLDVDMPHVTGIEL
ncbi:MAG TPA: response regulator, partial [Gemmatimonadaceae bacterium]|nr:response regulator [Gemmatimonadaceae bacterium]